MCFVFVTDESLFGWGVRDVADDDNLWKELYYERFGVCATADPPSWRELYRFG